MAEYYRSRIIKQRIVVGALVTGYIFLATLAYGHSYTHTDGGRPKEEAIVAFVFAPIYWLSVAGVWVFEEPAEVKARPNPFEEVD